jgi:hypothetical protein
MGGCECAQTRICPRGTSWDSSICGCSSARY